MESQIKRPEFDRDEYYEVSSRRVRWIVLALVLITFPFFDADNGLVVGTMVLATAIYNLLRMVPALLRHQVFSSRANTLAVDHVFMVILIMLSGGLASPYYPLFYLLIIGTIASYGIAGFAFSLSTQVLITLILLKVQLTPLPQTAEFQFVIKLVILIIFSLVAEQSVRSRDEEYLLESRFTRRIENERQRLLSLINSLSNAVLAIDEKGKVYLYNAAALELLNTNTDISGVSINTLLPLENADGHKVNMLKLITDENHSTNRQDLFYNASDGSKITLDLTVTPVHVFGYGKRNWGGYMVVFRDITKQKSLDEERDEFISVTSHELRTPLAIAEANLSTALLPGYARIDTKAKTLVTQAHENIVFLSELIEDLATLSRAERGDLKLQTTLVDAKELVAELAQDYRAQAEAKDLQFIVELPEDLGSVVTSRHELREIMQNFLTNAIKYTPSGSVTLGAERVEGGTSFYVRDTGIGISTSDKAKIFSKFYRSEDYRTRQTGGTGLGLYITHKLAEKLGMKIDFDSKLNHGSTFSIFAPIRSDAAAHAAVAHAAQDTKKA